MLAQDPQALENSYLYNYEHPKFGTLQAVGPVAYFSKTGFGSCRARHLESLDSIPRLS